MNPEGRLPRIDGLFRVLTTLTVALSLVLPFPTSSLLAQSNPEFTVVPYDPYSEPRNVILGRDWEVGTTVSLCIDDPMDGAGCDYTDSLTVPSEPNGFGGYQFEFDVYPSNFEIQGGQLVRLDNGLHSLQHRVTNLRLLWVDWDSDVVGGTADPGSEVGVSAIGNNQYVIRRVTTDSQGNWSVDFAHPGSAPDEQETFDLRLGHVFFIPGQGDEDGNFTQFWWQPPNPTFAARLTENEVHGYGWPLGASVTLTIDDPALPGAPDYTDAQTVVIAPWNPDATFVQFRLEQAIQLRAGQLIAMTDGLTTKTHTVADLAVTGVDADADTVSGTAAAGSSVDVSMCNEQGCFNRHEVAGGTHLEGMVDAGQVADQFLPSLLWGYDDALMDYAYNPTLARELLAEAGYPGGLTLNLWLREVPRPYVPDPFGTAEAIRDDLGAAGITANVEVLESGEFLDRVWNGEADLFLLGWIVDYEHPDNFFYHHFCTRPTAFGLPTADLCDQVMAARAEIDPEALVSLHQGISQQVHEGLPLVPLTHVRLPLLFRSEVSGFVPTGDGAGSFANATVAGGDIGYAFSADIAGLDPAVHFESRVILVTNQVMETLVRTDAGSATPLPGLAQSWSVSSDRLVWTFTIRSGVTFQDGTPLDAAAVLYNLERWWDPAHPHHAAGLEYFGELFNGFKGDPDCLITGLSLAGADQVQITLREPFSPLPHVLSMPSLAIASPAAIQTGTLDAHPVGTGPFTFMDQAPDGTVHLTANPGYWGSAPSLANLFFRVIPDETARFAALQANAVQGIEVENWGYALAAEEDPGLQVVWRPELNVAYLGLNQGHSPLDSLLVRQAIAHAIDKPALITQHYNTVVYDSGTWTATFAQPGDEVDEQATLDLQPGDDGEVAQRDDDGDITQISWHIPDPRLMVDFTNNSVTGEEWPVGVDVTLTIDDPGTSGVDFAETKVVEADPWGKGVPGVIFYPTLTIRASFVVTMSDGQMTKTHVVKDLAVTVVNPAADTVSGTAEPGASLLVWVDDACNYSKRTATADAGGRWVADFSVPGDKPQESPACDLQLGMQGRANQADEDGDSTEVPWPNPYLAVRLDELAIHGYEWPAGDTVTLTVDDPATPQNPDYTDTQTVGPETPWGGPPPTVVFDYGGAIDVRAGFVVRLTDGVMTKEHVVTTLALTGVDPETDRVTGTAQPGSEVIAYICDEVDCYRRHEITDLAGNWTANFAVPGDQEDEQTLFDIQVGTIGAVRQHDEDLDYTRVGWMVGSPVSPFVVLGQEGVWIEQNSTIVNGDVGANRASAGPYLSDQSEVTIGQRVEFRDPASRVMGDSIYLKQGAQVYDIYYNDLTGTGEVLGAHYTPVDLPLVPQFPALPTAQPGTQNLDVPKNGTLTLDAGEYGTLQAKKGATITFTGGVYHFAGWDLGQGVRVYFAAPTEIRIAGKLQVEANSFVGPAPAANSLGASDILVYVFGQNGNTGKLGATPKAATFGLKTTLIASVYAPNGTLLIREQSAATGAFLAKWVNIGPRVTLTLASGW